MTEFTTPMQLCREIGFVNNVLKPAQQEVLNEWDLRFNKKLYSPTPPPGIQIRDYILNTIPSEVYNIQNDMIKEPYQYI